MHISCAVFRLKKSDGPLKLIEKLQPEQKKKISSNFDGGRIQVLTCEDPKDIRLAIPKDEGAEFYQWFHFRLSGAADTACRIKLVDLAKSEYPNGRARATSSRLFRSVAVLPVGLTRDKYKDISHTAVPQWCIACARAKITAISIETGCQDVRFSRC